MCNFLLFTVADMLGGGLTPELLDLTALFGGISVFFTQCSVVYLIGLDGFFKYFVGQPFLPLQQMDPSSLSICSKCSISITLTMTRMDSTTGSVMG